MSQFISPKLLSLFLRPNFSRSFSSTQKPLLFRPAITANDIENHLASKINYFDLILAQQELVFLVLYFDWKNLTTFYALSRDPKAYSPKFSLDPKANANWERYSVLAILPLPPRSFLSHDLQIPSPSWAVDNILDYLASSFQDFDRDLRYHNPVSIPALSPLLVDSSGSNLELVLGYWSAKLWNCDSQSAYPFVDSRHSGSSLNSYLSARSTPAIVRVFVLSVLLETTNNNLIKEGGSLILDKPILAILPVREGNNSLSSTAASVLILYAEALQAKLDSYKD